MPPEEELAIEVAKLDVVHIGDTNDAAVAARDAHQGEILQQLAADGASADDEPTLCAYVLDEATTEHRYGARVAVIRLRCSITQTRTLHNFVTYGYKFVASRLAEIKCTPVGRQALERVKVEPLLYRHEYMRYGFHRLLRGDTADERYHRAQSSARLQQEEIRSES